MVNRKEEGRPIFDCGHKVLLLEIELKGERSILINIFVGSQSVSIEVRIGLQIYRV